MNNYLALTKILLKNSFNSAFSGKLKGKVNSKVKNTALIILIVISMIPIVIAIGAVVWSSYDVFKYIGQEGLILGSGFLSVSMVVLFFGIFYIMNVFYFSNDVESLLPLPLRPSEIMAAKFTVTLIYEYITELVILAPILISFGLVSKAGIVYYLYASLAFLTLPIIPLVYSGILNILLMRAVNIGRYRDRFRIIGGVIAMFLAIFVNLKMQGLMTRASDPEYLKGLLMGGNNSLLSLMNGIFPANKFLSFALINNSNLTGVVNIFLYIAISILFISLFLSLGEAWYFKGLIGISESKSRRNKLTSGELGKSVAASSAVRAYTMKELKLLFRTPVYFINCVMINFLWPVFLLLPLFVNLEGNGEMIQFQEMVKSASSDGLVVAIAFAAILFASGTNGVTSTAISREGTSIFVNKFIPVSYTEQLTGKIMAGVILGIGALLSMLIAAAVLAVKLYLLILIAVVGLLAVLFTSFIGILIDLNYPKLYWDSEQKAVKQNMNVLVSLLISIVAAAIVIAPVAILKLNLWMVFGALILIFGFANVVLYGLIKAAGASLLEKIEV